MHTKIVYNGTEYDADAAAELMDSEIREMLHAEIGGICTEQEFFDRYVSAHADKYGEAFVIN